MSGSDSLGRQASDLERAARLLVSTADLADPDDETTHLIRIHDALDVRRRADLVLATVVGTAREAGCSWQQIGEALGTTRQAAFQRFGRPLDPRTGRAMDRTPLHGADAVAIDIFTSLAAGRWQAVHERFDRTMAAALPPAQLADTWAVVVGAVGDFESAGEASVRRLGDLTVVDLPLAFEAGDMTGRVALHADGRVAGLFVLEPDQDKRVGP